MEKEPLTPKNQTSFHKTVKLDPPASPTKSKSPDAGINKQNDIRPDIGFFNNRDMFVCAPRPFLKQYGPRDIDDAAVTRCMDRMTKGKNAVMFCDRKIGVYGWVKFRTLPKDSGVHEDKTFKPLGDIIEAVLVDKTNGIHFRLVPNTELSSDIRGSTHKIDGAFLEIEFLGSPLPNRLIRGPIELKKYRHKWIRAVAHLQMLGACHHILNEDARRMWVYGLTFENDLASIWYFSRSHSVKSMTFNWITEPELLVKVLLAFAQATPEELGVDPTVHLGPAGKDGKDVSFVYEVPGDDGPLFFKTGKSRVSQRPMCIAGRATRVWEVTQVTAADGKEEVDGKTVILKDVWLDDSDRHSKTEAENMDAIFKAVDKMVKDGLDAEIKIELKSNPKATSEALLSDPDTVARLTMQFVKRHECFTAFDEAAKQRLCDNFINKNYRSLFLTKRHAWKGRPSKAVAEGAFRVYNFFHPKPLDEKAIEKLLEEEYANSRGFGTPSSSFHTLTSAFDAMKLDQDDEDDQSRRFARKRQSRFIYEEVCTTLENLQTVGDVVDVLCQTVDALHILYAVGWVHRDVSGSNIMAYRSSEDQPWIMKLADLEFARKMIDPARPPRTDPRTGTPFFMPVEIASKKYLFNEYLVDEDSEPDPYGVTTLATEMGVTEEDDSQAYQILSRIKEFSIPAPKIIVPAKPFWDRVLADVATVNHNFQHDLESVFWILVHIFSSRVGCKASSGKAAEYFKYDIKDHSGRVKLMSSTMIPFLNTLDSKLRGFRNDMAHLRRSLFEHYITRPMFGHLGVEESYSSIHAIFATTLRTIQSKEGPWRAMQLVYKSSLSDEQSVVPQTVIGKRTRDTHHDDEPARNARRFKAEGED